MPNYNGLVNVMKQAGVKATDASAPVHVCFGKVINTSPLQVLVDQKMTLGSAQLVLTRSVTIDNSLVIGDEVVLLRQQGGQKYIIVDRVG